MRTRKDYSNKRIGTWTVLYESIRKGKLWYWRCKCDCGTQHDFQSSYIGTEKLTTCRKCKQLAIEETFKKQSNEQIGKTYGTFTIIAYGGLTLSRSHRWLCRCQCGKEQYFLSCALFRKGKRKATQCKLCYNKARELSQQTQDEIPNRFWKRFCDQAARRNIEINLSKEELFELYLAQNKRCALTGEKLVFTKFRANFNRYTNASIDRIDSSKPYAQGNVQWVHKKVNLMKGSLSQLEFLTWCQRVVNGPSQALTF